MTDLVMVNENEKLPNKRLETMQLLTKAKKFIEIDEKVLYLRSGEKESPITERETHKTQKISPKGKELKMAKNMVTSPHFVKKNSELIAYLRGNIPESIESEITFKHAKSKELKKLMRKTAQQSDKFAQISNSPGSLEKTEKTTYFSGLSTSKNLGADLQRSLLSEHIISQDEYKLIKLDIEKKKRASLNRSTNKRNKGEDFEGEEIQKLAISIPPETSIELPAIKGVRSVPSMYADKPPLKLKPKESPLAEILTGKPTPKVKDLTNYGSKYFQNKRSSEKSEITLEIGHIPKTTPGRKEHLNCYKPKPSLASPPQQDPVPIFRPKIGKIRELMSMRPSNNSSYASVPTPIKPPNFKQPRENILGKELIYGDLADYMIIQRAVTKGRNNLGVIHKKLENCVKPKVISLKKKPPTKSIDIGPIDKKPVSYFGNIHLKMNIEHPVKIIHSLTKPQLPTFTKRIFKKNKKKRNIASTNMLEIAGHEQPKQWKFQGANYGNNLDIAVQFN